MALSRKQSLALELAEKMVNNWILTGDKKEYERTKNVDVMFKANMNLTIKMLSESLENISIVESVEIRGQLLSVDKIVAFILSEFGIKVSASIFKSSIKLSLENVSKHCICTLIKELKFKNNIIFSCDDNGSYLFASAKNNNQLRLKV